MWIAVCGLQVVVSGFRVVTMRMILASVSPRRRELLEGAGVAFEVMPSPATELHDASMAPAELCEENARRKAVAVAEVEPDAWVIGSDTLVFLDDHPLGKPVDLVEARAMLRSLSGRTHQVCTGVCVVSPSRGVRCFHETTAVTFRCLSDEAIDDYVSRVNPLDKAGAYGIQEFGEWIIERIEGRFDTVMGLPVEPLLEQLREDGWVC